MIIITVNWTSFILLIISFFGYFQNLNKNLTYLNRINFEKILTELTPDEFSTTNIRKESNEYDVRFYSIRDVIDNVLRYSQEIKYRIKKQRLASET